MLFKDIKKTCKNCKKEFIISKESQEMALKKGGEIHRHYCHECLKKWNRGKINLE